MFTPIKKLSIAGVSTVARGKQTRLVSTRMLFQSLTSLRGLRIWHCHELWCKLQTWLGCGIAVAVPYAKPAALKIHMYVRAYIYTYIHTYMANGMVWLSFISCKQTKNTKHCISGTKFYNV